MTGRYAYKNASYDEDVRKWPSSAALIVGLRARAGEHHLAVGTVEHRGNAVARGVDGVARRTPRRVDRGGIAELAIEIRQHRLPGSGGQRRGGRVIQVNAFGRH